MGENSIKASFKLKEEKERKKLKRVKVGAKEEGKGKETFLPFLPFLDLRERNSSNKVLKKNFQKKKNKSESGEDNKSCRGRGRK